MKKAIEQLNLNTLAFLQKQLTPITSCCLANEFFLRQTGIETFFSHENEFLLFKELLYHQRVIREAGSRREYGDYQTPIELTDQICKYLRDEGINPAHLLEPTFGQGTFLLSSLKHFSNLQRIDGIEIYEPYIWHTKFKVLDYFFQHPTRKRPIIHLYHHNIFDFNFNAIADTVSDNLLILGNPPWVTNAELGSLQSNNLPAKTNLKKLSGLDAITGQSNFDISEYILLMLLDSFGRKQGHLAMLVKNAVIKNLVHDLPKHNYSIFDLKSYSINAKKYFGAAVEASLLSGQLNPSNSTYQCRISSLDSPNQNSHSFGWLEHKFISHIDLYHAFSIYDGNSSIIWRQGIKHDCAKVMELVPKAAILINGFKEEVPCEEERLFCLAKSSDLTQPLLRKTRKRVIVTQNRIGEKTIPQLQKFPHLFAYLKRYEDLFNRRKSSIYRNQPPYAMFGVGDYSFKLYKVAISGLYKSSQFCLVLPENNKPVMLDDTCYFVGFDHLSHAIYIWAALNNWRTQGLLNAITFKDAKRPYTKKVLMRLNIDDILNDIAYEEIHTYIAGIDTKLLSFVSESEWHLFNRSRISEPNQIQLTLFEN